MCMKEERSDNKTMSQIFQALFRSLVMFKISSMGNRIFDLSELFKAIKRSSGKIPHKKKHRSIQSTVITLIIFRKR